MPNNPWAAAPHLQLSFCAAIVHISRHHRMMILPENVLHWTRCDRLNSLCDHTDLCDGDDLPFTHPPGRQKHMPLQGHAPSKHSKRYCREADTYVHASQHGL